MKIAIIDYEIGNLANVYNAWRRLGQDPALSRKRRLFRFPYQSFHGAPSCRRTLYHTAAPFCKQFFVHSKKFHSKD